MDRISFQYNSQESFNLREFYDEFRDRFPLWVIVTEGNDGDTTYDDFCNNQVIRFHKVCTQRRVMVRETQEVLRHSKTCLSIPVKSKFLYCVVHGPNRVDEPKYLEEILKVHEPHFLIRLASGQNANFGETKEGDMDDLLVLKEYTEYYMQGNCLTHDGLLELPCTASLTEDISVAFITGINGKSRHEFRDILEKMDLFVKEKVQFDDEIDNQLIRKYKFGDVELKGIISSEMFFPGEDIYATPDLPPRPGEGTGSVYETLKPDPHWVPPRPPKPKIPQESNYSQIPDEKILIPPRKPTKIYEKDFEKSVLDLEKKGTYVTTLVSSNEHAYSKPILRNNSVRIKEESEPRYERLELREDSCSSIKEHSIHKTNLVEYKAVCHEVENLSVQDLGHKLKLLKLDKYVKNFKKERIDGLLLSKLTDDILRTEFKFTQTEVIRLMTYVKSGHLPH